MMYASRCRRKFQALNNLRIQLVVNLSYISNQNIYNRLFCIPVWTEKAVIKIDVYEKINNGVNYTNWSVLLTQYCAGGKIDTNEMGRACGAYGEK
jgi:hypothetical protein